MAQHAAQCKHRRTILKAARIVFDARGYADATVDEIAAHARISKGSIYNYFSSKEDLFAELFVETFEVEHAEVGENSLVALKRGLLTALRAWSGASS